MLTSLAACACCMPLGFAASALGAVWLAQRISRQPNLQLPSIAMPKQP